MNLSFPNNSPHNSPKCLTRCLKGQLALQLHFSAAPAQLSQLLMRQGHKDIGQICHEDWQRALSRLAEQFPGDELLPQLSWERWKQSRCRSRELVQSFLAATDAAEYLASLLIYGSPGYPQPLYQLFHPPFVLFSRGRQKLLDPAGSSGFAVCGSRKVTLKGRRDAFALAYGVGRSQGNFHLVSGLSEGIELTACDGALAAGAPVIGILCCGLNAIAPPEALRHAARILNSGGLLLSEYLPEQPRQRYTFLQRNRILAALAASLIFAEMGPKTKALNLVNYALELNRDMAVLGDSVGIQRLREQGCAHWPDAPALLRALGMDVQVQPGPMRSESAGEHHIGPELARSLKRELTQQSLPYLGCQVSASYPSITQNKP